MKWLSWIGLLLVSSSWLFYLPIFKPEDFVLGSFILLLGLIFNIIAFRKKDIKIVDKRYLIFTIPLLLSLLVIPFPFSIGPLTILLGLVVLGISLKSFSLNRLYQLWPGIFFTGLILTIQTFVFPLYVKIGARFHGSEILASFTNFFGNLLGLNLTNNSDTIFVGLMNKNPAMIVSWESIGFILWFNILIGLLIIFLFYTDKKRIITDMIIFLFISFFYLFIRYISIVFILVEIIESEEVSFLVGLLDMFYDPLFIVISFIPFIFLTIKFISFEKFEMNFEWLRRLKINKKQIISILLIFVFVFSTFGAFYFQDPGTKKNGRILVDELHSDWEDSVKEMDKEWYGRLSTYNMYSWAEWLKHYYTIDQNLNYTLTSDLLSNYDILVLKCPTSPYSNSEVKAIVSFVENGGGLYLIGDHTNVFGMNTYLNKIAKNFGIWLNTDATHEYSAPGGFSKFIPSSSLAHPIVQNMPEFQFLTSCTIDAPLHAEDVILDGEISTFPGTYSTPAFFVEDKMWEMTKGFFLQVVAYKHGKGRVVVFSDSTVFSSYAIFLSGFQEFNLGTLEYLNRENTYAFMNIIFIIFSILSFILFLFFMKKEKLSKVLFFLVATGVLFASISTISFSHINNVNYPLPKPHTSIENRICFEEEYSSGVISAVPSFALGSDFSKSQKENFNTFYVWSQRVGCFPSVEKNLEDATRKGSLVVIINPVKQITQNDLNQLINYVSSGGKLLILDSVYNFDTKSNSILNNFGISITSNNEFMDSDIATNQNMLYESLNNHTIGSNINPYLSISGGTSILIDDTGNSVFSIIQYGKGLVSVFVDSITFSQEVMGGVFAIPDSNMRQIYDTEYYILESLMNKNEDYEASSLKGYLYNDLDNDENYNITNDSVLKNINLTISKIDIVNPEIKEDYFTYAETYSDNNGYFSFSNLLPGFYEIKGYKEGYLVIRDNVFLKSGTASYKNVSMIKNGSFQGVVYFDNNNNLEYDLNEEINNANIELFYVNSTQDQVLISKSLTDSNGRFNFTSLYPGQYKFYANVVNSTTSNNNYYSEGNVYVYEGQFTDYDIVLYRSLVRVEGKIYYENSTISDIKAIFKANLSVENNDAYPILTVQSNLTGDYWAQLYPGFYNITIEQSVNESGQIYIYKYKTDIELKLGEGTRKLDIHLNREPE